MHRLSVLLLMTAVAGLLALGIVMLASTGEFAQDAHGRPYFFLKHQLMWLGLGVVGCAVMANIGLLFCAGDRSKNQWFKPMDQTWICDIPTF
jgi:cell division protein FtsW (lipid II flippase)